MRYYFLSLTLLLFSFCSKAADVYTSIKSSLYETISSGFNVQLIDANLPGHYLLIHVKSHSKLESEFTEFEYNLTGQGYQVNYSTNSTNHYLVVKLPRENIDTTLQQFLTQFNKKEIVGIELVILGSINQQRLLGVINRLYKSSDLVLSEPDLSIIEQYNISLRQAAPDSPQASNYDWKLSLATALFSCDYLHNGAVRFNYFSQTLSCDDYMPNASLTDKEVANLKDSLHSSIQLSVETPESFIQYISSFQSERRLDESQAFFANLPNLSIDSILSYHYKRILNVQDTTVSSPTESETFPTYQFPSQYKVKSDLLKKNSKAISFVISIQNPQTCIQLNCQSLSSLSYIEYTHTSDTHTFSIRFSSENETSIIDGLNKVLFIPLSTSPMIAQEDIVLSLYGGFLLEAYDDSFNLLASLPLVSHALSDSDRHRSKDNHVKFYLEKSCQCKVVLEIPAVPAGELWEESELFYFILFNKLKKYEPKLEIMKANTMVQMSMPWRIYIEPDGSPIVIEYDSSNIEDIERVIRAVTQEVAAMSDTLSRDQFVAYKNGLKTNLGLLDSDEDELRHIAQLFDLDSPAMLLINRVDSLSYEQFQAYLNNSLPYSPVTISTNRELEQEFQQQVINLLEL